MTTRSSHPDIDDAFIVCQCDRLLQLRQQLISAGDAAHSDESNMQEATGNEPRDQVDDGNWLEQQANSEAFFLVERWYRQKHGGPVFGVGAVVSIDPPDGQACVWFIRDVAPVMRESQAIERRSLEQEQAVSAARDANAAKDQLLAVVSHELRQPLTELLLHADRLQQLTCCSDAARLIDIGEAVKSAVRRQVRIIDDLLEFSRIRIGKLRLEPTLVDIAGMVRAACDVAALKAPKVQIHIDVQYVSTKWCMADPVRVEQILSNLLGNAIKFSAGSGRIDVQLAIDRGHARISVNDTGCGIAAEFLPHIFSMFGQERPSLGSADMGLGIGLALVRELAEAHGGRVEARSDGPGCGAQLIVWLPLADNSPDPGTMTPRPIATVPPSDKRPVPSQRVGA